VVKWYTNNAFKIKQKEIIVAYFEVGQIFLAFVWTNSRKRQKETLASTTVGNTKFPHPTPPPTANKKQKFSPTQKQRPICASKTLYEQILSIQSQDA
jgi:hypothetical protein